MFDHIGIGASNLEASKTFFVKALAPLGVTVVMEVPDAVGWDETTNRLSGSVRAR